MPISDTDKSQETCSDIKLQVNVVNEYRKPQHNPAYVIPHNKEHVLSLSVLYRDHITHPPVTSCMFLCDLNFISKFLSL